MCTGILYRIPAWGPYLSEMKSTILFLLDSRQTDCYALLVDIEIFCRNVLRFYRQTTNISSLHKGIQLTYTTCRYLQDLLLANPCFHEMPPPPSRPPQKPKKMRRSTWNY